MKYRTLFSIVLLFFGLFVFGSQIVPAHAAVAFDAGMTTGYGTGGKDNDIYNSTSNDVNMTIGSGATCLVGMIEFLDESGGITPVSNVSMSWDRTQMTPEATSAFGGSFDMYDYIFALTNPATGYQTLSSTWTGTVDNYLSAMSFTGTSRINCVKASDNAFTTSTAATSTLNINTDSLGATVANEINTVTTPTTNQTQIWADDPLSSGGAGTYAIGGSVANAHTFNIGGTANSIIVGVHIQAPTPSTPLVSWITPSNNATVSSNITLTASSTDASSSISSVAFYKGNYGATLASSTFIGSTSVGSGNQYSISWNTSNASNGSTTLWAVSTDANYNTASASITVKIQNSGTYSSITQVEAKCVGGNTSTVTFSTSTTAGELITVGGMLYGGTSNATSVSDNAPGGSSVYTAIATTTLSDGGNGFGNFYYAYNVKAGITNVTVNTNGNTNNMICAAHYTGVATTSNPLDVDTSFNSPTGTPWASPGTGNLIGSNDLAVGFVGNSSNQCAVSFTINASTFPYDIYNAGCSGPGAELAYGFLSSDSSISLFGTTVGASGNGNVAAVATFFPVFTATSSGFTPAPGIDSSSTNFFLRGGVGSIFGNSQSTHFMDFNNGQVLALATMVSGNFKIISGIIRAIFQPLKPFYELIHYHWRNDNGTEATATSAGAPAISLVEVESYTGNVGGSSTVTFNTPTTAGELIVLEAYTGVNGTDIGTPTDNMGDTYHEAYVQPNLGGHYSYSLWYAYNVPAGVTAVSSTQGTGNLSYGLSLIAAHYTGIATSSNPLDVSSSTVSYVGSPWASPAVTTQEPNELMVGQDWCYGTCSFAATGNWTMEATSSDDAENNGMMYEDQIVSSIQTNASSTGTGNTENYPAIATFKGATGLSEDTPLTGLAQNTSIRLRMEITNDGGTVLAYSPQSLQLQYGQLSGSYASISQIEATSTVLANATNGNATATFNTATTAGEFVLVAVDEYGYSTSTVTDNEGDTYTNLFTSEPATGAYVEMWYLADAPSGITSIDIGQQVAHDGRAWAMHYTGVATSSPPDVFAVPSGPSSTPWASTPISTTNTNDLLIGNLMGNYYSGSNCNATTTGSWISDGSFNNDWGDGGSFITSYQMVTNTGSYQYTGTDSGGTCNHYASIVAFKAAASSNCSTISSWTTVGGPGSTWSMYNSSNLTDGANTTDIATSTGGVIDANHTFIVSNAGVKTTTSTVNSISIPSDSFIETEFDIQALSSSTPGATYCFRLTNNGSTNNFTYPEYPEATLASSFTQSITLTLNTSTVNLPALAPGIAVSATTTATVNVSGATSGYTVSIQRNPATATTTIASGTIQFPDYTPVWAPSGSSCVSGEGNGTTTPGNTFSFRVASSGTTANYCPYWWGTNDTGAALYAGVPTTTQIIVNSTSSASQNGTTTVTIFYSANAPVNQRVTNYTGGVTITAIANP